MGSVLLDQQPGREVSMCCYRSLQSRLCQPTPVLTAYAVVVGWQKGTLILILREILEALIELWTFKVFEDPLNSDF